jgi:hypothetical protein
VQRGHQLRQVGCGFRPLFEVHARTRWRGSRKVPDLPNLLVAEPAVRTDIKIGYARVSTDGRSWNANSTSAPRPGALGSSPTEVRQERVASGTESVPCGPAGRDTLVMPSLDRYGWSLQDLITMVGELRKREIGFTSLYENLDTTTPGGRLVNPPPYFGAGSIREKRAWKEPDRLTRRR